MEGDVRLDRLARGAAGKPGRIRRRRGGPAPRGTEDTVAYGHRKSPPSTRLFGGKPSTKALGIPPAARCASRQNRPRSPTSVSIVSSPRRELTHLDLLEPELILTGCGVRPAELAEG